MNPNPLKQTMKQKLQIGSKLLRTWIVLIEWERQLDESNDLNHCTTRANLNGLIVQ